QHAILTSALSHIPTHGFSQTTLSLAAQEQGLPEISIPALLPRGAADLVLFRLQKERLALSRNIQPWFSSPSAPTSSPPSQPHHGRTDAPTLRNIILTRLAANRPIVTHLKQSLALISLVENLTPAVNELELLADEIVYLAGGKDLGPAWYASRMGIMGIYFSAEILQSNPNTEWRDVEGFVYRRVDEFKKVGSVLGSIGEWAYLQARGVVQLGRNTGMGI
ncbi:ubiquinone biosynthesis protein COQ9, partial [Piedraia hortae CBS 480.64]